MNFEREQNSSKRDDVALLEVLDAAIVLADKIRFSIGVHKAARSEVRSFFFRHTVEAHAEIDVEHLRCT